MAALSRMLPRRDLGIAVEFSAACGGHGREIRAKADLAKAGIGSLIARRDADLPRPTDSRRMETVRWISP